MTTKRSLLGWANWHGARRPTFVRSVRHSGYLSFRPYDPHTMRDGLRRRLRRAGYLERRLVRLDDPAYWIRRAKWRRRLRRAAVLLFGIRSWTEERKEDSRALKGLLGGVLLRAVLALAALTSVNALTAWLGRYFHLGSFFAGVGADSYSTAVAAGEGALATFLALFFTTVGVIAATAYADVPGEIRDLFLRERTTTYYVGIVVTALVFGAA